MTIPNEKTAHDLWCEQGKQRLEAVLYPPSMKDKKLAFMITRTTLRERCDQALSIFSHHETTRLRIVIEAMIALLDATSRRRQEIKDEHHATPWYRFAKRRRLQRQDQDQLLLQEGYKNAVKVISNTPPPAALTPEELRQLQERFDIEESHEKLDQGFERVKPKEINIDLRTLIPVCDQCGGTGYAGPNPSEHFLCTHCGGSGTEPRKGGSHE